MSLGSAGEYQADEQADIAGLSWRLTADEQAGVMGLSWQVSGRRTGGCRKAQLTIIRHMSRQVSRGSNGV